MSASTITAASNNKDNIRTTVKQQHIGNKNGKKNNYIDTSGDKLGDCTRDGLDVVKKGKPEERKLISFNSSTK